MIPQNQGSLEWLKFRKDRLGGSDAAAIMGVSPFKTIGQLFDEKLSRRPPDEPNEHMRRGNELEEEARQCFECMCDEEVFPRVRVSSEYHWQIASLDGISLDGSVIVEIKCPGQKDHDLALQDIIPQKYIPQLQHTMAVTGADSIFYFSYRDGKGKIVSHKRDQAYIDRLIAQEKAFYEILMKAKEKIDKLDDELELMKDEVYKLVEELHDSA